MRVMESGPYVGHRIRRARKAGACEKRVSREPFARCGKPINVGDDYVDGDYTGKVGGLQPDRICMTCAGAPQLR